MSELYYENPAYLGYAKDLPADDERHEKFAEQFEERGFDDTVTWSLDGIIGQFIYPRLKAYHEKASEVLAEPELMDTVQTMLEGFEIMLDEQRYFECAAEDVAKVDKAFELLAKNYRSIWW